MAQVDVKPETFALVDYDGALIADLVSKLIDEMGLEVETVVVDVDETNPLGRAEVTSTDPLTLGIEGGAFEDPKRPRQLSPEGVTGVVGRVLFQHGDRLDPDFDAPEESDDELDLAYVVAWQIYAVARLARLGYPSQYQRRLYHFRNRCGFTDAADAAFEAIWSGENLTWSDLTDLVDGAVAAREPAA